MILGILKGMIRRAQPDDWFSGSNVSFDRRPFLVWQFEESQEEYRQVRIVEGIDSRQYILGLFFRIAFAHHHGRFKAEALELFREYRERQLRRIMQRTGNQNDMGTLGSGRCKGQGAKRAEG